MKNHFLGAVYLSLAASIWGGMYVVSKYVLDFVPPLTLVLFRYIIAFAVLFSILKITQRNKTRLRFQKNDWMLFAWIGFIGYFVSISLQFIGTKLSDAHTGALITSATPAFIVLFAKLVLKESITIRKLAALFFATVGVVIVIGFKENTAHSFWGSIILVGAAVTWALLSVYVKLASFRFSILTITTYAILFAIFFTAPLAVWELQSNEMILNNTYVILGILYLGIVSTTGAFFLWNKGMELMDAGIGSLFFFFQPLVGSFFGWLLLGEHLDKNFFIGGLFILVSAFIVVAKQNEE
ncbi:MAG TPA: EamA family transporter [Anoxybacillus sp.]|nr:EamA family transporter [Anoxybacillus sp.]